MCFEDKIKDFTKKLPEIIENTKNETSTIMFLISPFLKILEYNLDSNKLKFEYKIRINPSNGKTKYGNADIVILDNDNEPEVVIECKSVDKKLDKRDIKQLEIYFALTGSRIGILTNGIVYKFFISTNKRMDKEPFIEFDLSKIKEEDISWLKIFKKGNYNPKTITEIAKNIKHNNKIKKILEKEFESPSTDFVKLISKKVDKGVMNKNKIIKYRKIIKNNIKSIVEDGKEPQGYPIYIKYKGFSKEEIEDFIQKYNKLPEKFKNDEFIENNTIIKITKGDKIPKSRLYTYDHVSKPIEEILVKYLKKYAKEYAHIFFEEGILKDKSNLNEDTTRKFVKYLNDSKNLNEKEEEVLNKIFSSNIKF